MARKDEVNMSDAIDVIDATAIINEPSSYDEAIAYFVSYAVAGDKISLHCEDCPAYEYADGKCDCTPVVLEFGAVA